ncbi:MAG: 30S ribosomal protein S8 [Candidatus Parcubacteria bacterium]|nr:30S ribosomal protein S8 [Candidatus Paceibacterota bacterium]
MSMFDLMSDFVARVNNAVTAQKSTVKVLKNNLVTQVCKKLVKLNYFESFAEGEDYELEVVLTKNITKLTRISKPGKRVYTGFEKFPRVIGGKGWNIITSSKGVLTNFEAKEQKVGGELLFQII